VEKACPHFLSIVTVGPCPFAEVILKKSFLSLSSLAVQYTRIALPHRREDRYAMPGMLQRDPSHFGRPEANPVAL
jgi:hypothetical protein